MQCKHLRFRSKQYKKYTYCCYLKEEITLDRCNDCNSKEYKEFKPISKYKPKARTKATSISANVKEIVWERDNHKCIFCGKSVPLFNANAHYIKRSQGGLGIPMNIFTACDICHREEDNGLECERYEKFAGQYLKEYYGDNWDRSKLIYKKGD